MEYNKFQATKAPAFWTRVVCLLTHYALFIYLLVCLSDCLFLFANSSKWFMPSGTRQIVKVLFLVPCSGFWTDPTHCKIWNINLEPDHSGGIASFKKKIQKEPFKIRQHWWIWNSKWFSLPYLTKNCILQIQWHTKG